MRGEAVKLTKMLQGTRTRFVIPVYQRNYDWKREQCKRLFDDLTDVAREERESHFFGSIVSQADGDTKIIIDGQQRITTVYLLLTALLEQIRSGNVPTGGKERLAEFIQDEYLVDRYAKDDSKLKLKLVKGDQAALAKVMNAVDSGNDGLDEDSNVTVNYRYFLDRIAQSGLDAGKIEDAVEKLEVIDIKLESGDDAQLIFESLNSTGLGLSEGDKIRNFMLMNLPLDQQEMCYERYWNVMERNTSYDVSAFIRDYLTMKTRRTPVISQVYSSFRQYAKDFEPLNLMNDMLRFSRYFGRITGTITQSSSVDDGLRRLRLLEMSVINPFLLSLLEYVDDGEMTSTELQEVFHIVEDYLFRRWMCNVATNALNKVFAGLHHEVLRGVTEGSTYCESLKYALLRREGSGRFPDDEEFHHAYNQRNLYEIRHMRFYLYDCLENDDNVERVNVVDMLERGKLSVEHIMPQTLSRQWRQCLGADADDIHNLWLNRMGNLTLTGYNSRYSNSEFSFKRDCEHGFKDSGLKLNRFIADCDSWGEEQIVERNELLWKRFLELWPAIETSYRPVVEERETHALDEDFVFTNRKIAAYTFQGARHVVKTWVDMMQGVLVGLYGIDPVALRAVAFSDKFPSRYFSDSPLEYGFEVGTGIWFDPGW
ncbi:DUF262 domain-containing protein [Bifidobacterium leontopitheci]|uniref:DUF262 domain-containing protein n=1 Tax=Bifidobacterium leontopitheci TaxID=2650774 RepID=A0A6I1GH37_9BIFI|nr:DUF262 domain-containing protein [Bifidobacterium leontopitheci]KAB7790022.1 hypothetical protein F7D09_1440 [Bifidobacterium leontopitheci]